MKKNRHIFIVGAQRSGTTYLCKILDQHSDIEIAKPISPEPKFFLKMRSKKKCKDLYESSYFHDNTKIVKIEKSTSYFESKTAADGIWSLYPDAKIIAVLRDPISRAISNYWFTQNYGLEKHPLNEALRMDLESINRVYPKTISVSPYKYVCRGNYAKYLNLYNKFNKKGNLKVVVMENMLGSRKVIDQILDFIEVPKNGFKYTGINSIENEGHYNPQTLDKTLYHQLVKYFKRSNNALQKIYKIDISRWTHEI